MELKDTIAALKDGYKKLPVKDHQFALSLVQQYLDKGALSPKQASWAEKLLSWAEGKPTPFKAMVKPSFISGNFGAVYALFAKAKEHLKYPKIKLAHPTLAMPDKSIIMLALAGSKSKVPGVVNVTDGGKYGENIWYGRVYPDGKFEANSKVSPEALVEVQKMLVALALDPAKVVAEHGKLTGNCSFCDSPLSHENSTAVGYGPVCAKHFGLYDQWKAAAKAAGFSVQDMALAATKSETKHLSLAPSKKPVMPAHLAGKPIFTLKQKKPGLTIEAVVEDGVLVKLEEVVAQTIADAVDKEIMSGLKKERELKSARAKKKVVVDNEREEYLF